MVTHLEPWWCLLVVLQAPGWFYTNPDKLTAYVARLQEEVEALEVAQHMQ